LALIATEPIDDLQCIGSSTPSVAVDVGKHCLVSLIATSHRVNDDQRIDRRDPAIIVDILGIETIVTKNAEIYRQD